MNEKCLNLIDYFLIIGKQEIHEKRDDNNLKDMNALASSDILITHDATFKNNSYRVGLIGIDYYLVKNKVNYHFHGHLHNSYENIYPNGTKEVCVYKYRIINI